jgi:cell division transport system permease protein
MNAFFVREALRSLSTHRGLALTAVFSLTAALTLCAVFLLLSHNAHQTLRAVGDRREMILYLEDEVSDADVQALLARVREYYGIGTFVSRAEAWEEFSQQIGDPDLLKAVDTNPLPASVRVRLRPELLNHIAMERAAREMAEFPEVEDVRYGAEWVRRLDAISDGLRRITLVLGAVVALAIILVLHNTLRLTVLARRAQVEIMARLGASDRFIATPFVLEALIVTLAAALAALALAFGLQQGVATRISGLGFLPLEWCAAFVGGALLLAWIAATVAMTRILRTVGP